MSYTIYGTFIDLDNAQKAKKNLNSMTNNKIHVNETGREMYLDDAINTYYLIAGLSRLELSKAIIWTASLMLGSISLGLLALFNFWSPSNANATAFIVAIYSIGGLMLGGLIAKALMRLNYRIRKKGLLKKIGFVSAQMI